MRSAKLIAGLSLLAMLALSTRPTLADAYFWRASTPGGFYETPTSWIPNSVPTDEESTMLFFDHADFSPQVGLLQDHAVGEVLVTNGFDLRLATAGANPTNKRLDVAGDFTIDNGILRMETGSGSDVTLGVGGKLSVDGQLNAYDGAKISSGDANIGNGHNDKTFIVLRGDDLANGSTTWNVDGGIYVGNESEAQLVVDEGAVLNSDLGRVGSGREEFDQDHAFVRGVGRDGTPSTWNTDLLSVAVGTGASAIVNVLDGGRINSTHGLIGVGGRAIANVWRTDANGNPSTWNSDVITVADTSEAFLQVRHGGRVNVGQLIVSRDEGSVGTLTINADEDSPTSTVNATQVEVGGFGQGGRGTVDVLAGGRLNADQMVIHPNNLVNLDGGMIAADYIQVKGGFLFRNGTLQVDTFEADMQHLGGKLAPGPGTQVSTILGSYTQVSDPVIEIEIAGDQQYDRVAVDGNASLDGDLELYLQGDYRPESDDTFRVMLAENILGRLNNAGNGDRLLTADQKGTFVVNYGFGSEFEDTEMVLSDFTPSLCGDFDFDGDVDSADRTQQAKFWTGALAAGIGTREFSQGDCDFDGDIDTADQNGMLQNWTGAKTDFAAVDLQSEAKALDLSSMTSSLVMEAELFEQSGNADAYVATTQFGVLSSTSQVVPEPNSIVLILSGLLGLVQIARRGR